MRVETFLIRLTRVDRFFFFPLTSYAARYISVDEYVTPTNPTPEEVERVWSDFTNSQSPPGTPSPVTPGARPMEA